MEIPYHRERTVRKGGTETMSESIETGLIVTVTHETENGYEMEDIVEISMTFKFGSILTAEKLGIAHHEDAKVITMRDRDQSLLEYEGIVPEEILGKIRGVVPHEVLKSMS
jgi:hypothetical protein